MSERREREVSELPAAIETGARECRSTPQSACEYPKYRWERRVCSILFEKETDEREPDENF